MDAAGAKFSINQEEELQEIQDGKATGKDTNEAADAGKPTIGE